MQATGLHLASVAIPYSKGLKTTMDRDMQLQKFKGMRTDLGEIDEFPKHSGKTPLLQIFMVGSLKMILEDAAAEGYHFEIEVDE